MDVVDTMDEWYKIAHSENFGDYVVAEKTFEEGDMVLKEELSISSAIVEEGMGDEPEFSCVGCYKIVPSDWKTCSKCHFPVCSDLCSEDELHSQLECKVLAENEIAVSQETFGYIKYLRIFLSKEVFPARYEKFQLLSTEFDEGMEYDSLKVVIAAFSVWNFLTEECKVEASFSEVKMAFSAIVINSFMISSEDTNGTRYRGVAVSSWACKMNHSCMPSLEWFFSKTEMENGKVKWYFQAHATRKIIKGDTLSIAYAPYGLAYGTGFRRDKYQTKLPFRCVCLRCVSPTEEGTHFSSPKCLECKLGYFVPEDPLSSSTCSWKCTRCSFVKSGEDIEMAISKDGNYVSSLMNQEPSSLDLLDKFIEENSGKALHPNHFLIFQATVYWLTHSDWTETLMKYTDDSLDLYNKIESRYYQCIPLVKKFINTMAIVQLEMAMVGAIIAFAFKTDDHATIMLTHTDPRLKLRYSEMIKDHLSRANFWMQRQAGCQNHEEQKEALKSLYDIWALRFDMYKDDLLLHEEDMEDVALLQIRGMFD